MTEPLDEFDYAISGVMDIDDVIIEHHEGTFCYQYECGRSFIEICKDMGLDKNNHTNISFL